MICLFTVILAVVFFSNHSLSIYLLAVIVNGKFLCLSNLRKEFVIEIPAIYKFSSDFQMHLRLCLLLALGCIASSQRFQQARGPRRPGGPAGRGPGGPRGQAPRRALLGAPEVQRRGPGGLGPVSGGVPDSFARRQSASIRPGQGERRYQVFTDPTQVCWLKCLVLSEFVNCIPYFTCWVPVVSLKKEF